MRRIPVLLVVLFSLINFACFHSRTQLQKAAELERQGQYDKALDIYQDAFLRSNPKDNKVQAELMAHMGECFEKSQRVPEAYAAFEKAVQLDPENGLAHFHLGEIYLLAGDPKHAADEAQILLKNPATSSPDAMALYGAAAEAAGQEDIARGAFERVLQRDPGRVKVAVDLAELYNRAGDVDKARETLKNASAARPQSALPLLALGRVEEQEGHPPAAEEAYRKAVAAENTGETNLRLAQFYQRSGLISEARAVLKRVDLLRNTVPSALADFNFVSENYTVASEKYLSALQGKSPAKDTAQISMRRAIISRLIESDLAQAESNDAEVRRAALAAAQQHFSTYGLELDEAGRSLLQAEIALADDDLLQAAIASTQALEKAPDSPAAHYVSGIVRYRSSDLAAARAEWQLAVDNDPNFVPARIAVAEDSLKDQEYAGAMEMIVPAVRQEPSNVRALVIFARVLIGSGTPDSARTIAKRIAALAPDSPYPHILRGEAALAGQQYSMALLEFQQAVLMDARSRDAVDGLAQVYAAGNVTRPMLLKMEQVGKAQPGSATLLEITGRNFLNLGLTQDAERCLRESLEIDPNRHTAAEWLARLQAKNGDLASASRSVAQVKEFSPLLAAIDAEQQNDFKQAVLRYEQAVRRGDPSGVAANNLAWLLAQQHRELDRALALANRASELQPENPAVLDTVGYVRLERREYSDALRVLEKALQIASLKSYADTTVTAAIRRHLAEAYIRTGQPKRAQVIAKLNTR